MSFDQDLAALSQSMNLMGAQIQGKKLSANQGILSGYSEYTSQIITTANASTLTLDVRTANIFELTLAHASTKINPTNVPVATTEETAAAKRRNFNLTLKLVHQLAGSVIDWTGFNVVWQDGVAPVQSSVAGKIDVIVLETDNGGTSWRGYVAGTGR